MNQAPYRRLSDHERQQMIDLKAQGCTYEQIAQVVGKARSTVWQALHGRVPPVAGKRAREAVELHRQGVPWDKIAQAVGYANGHVARVSAYKHIARQARIVDWE